jgi:hypothetical protein
MSDDIKLEELRVDEHAFQQAVNRWEESAPIHILLDIKAYKQHFLDEWGIDMFNSTWGKGPKVVDEKKYMWFLLSFGNINE